MLRQIIFLLLHQLFTIAFLIAVQQKRFFMKAFRRSYDSVSRHYKFPELKNTEDIGNKTIGFQKTVNSFCKNICRNHIIIQLFLFQCSNRVNIVLLWIIYEYGRNKEKRSVWKMIAKNHLGI